jgi:hypothetical protein
MVVDNGDLWILRPRTNLGSRAKVFLAIVTGDKDMIVLLDVGGIHKVSL